MRIKELQALIRAGVKTAKQAGKIHKIIKDGYSYSEADIKEVYREYIEDCINNDLF